VFRRRAPEGGGQGLRRPKSGRLSVPDRTPVAAKSLGKEKVERQASRFLPFLATVTAA
jgi:hypothetical protein